MQFFESEAAKLDIPGACRGVLIFLVSVFIKEQSKLIDQHFKKRRQGVELQRFTQGQGFIPNVTDAQNDEDNDELKGVYPTLLVAQ